MTVEVTEQTTAERVVQARRVLKLRQADLAQALGVSVETVSRWERGATVRKVYLDRLDDMLASQVTRNEPQG